MPSPPLIHDRSVNNLGNRSGKLFLIVAFFVFFILFFGPGLSSAGTQLDTSWRQVLDYAFQHHLTWGKDIIFTYGPWGFARPDGVFSPDLFWQHYAIQIWLAACFALLSVITLSNLTIRKKIALSLIILLTYSLSWDAYLSSYFLISFFACNGSNLEKGNFRSFIIAIPALSFLSLVKFSLFPLYAAWICLSAVNTLATKFKRSAISIGCAGIIAPLAWWMLAYQPLTAFPAYISTSIEISRFYNGAMGITPSSFYTIFGLAIIALLLIVSWRRISAEKYHLKMITSVTFYLASTALAWKAGFVRADGHVALFFAAAAISSPLIALHPSPSGNARHGSLFTAILIALASIYLGGQGLGMPTVPYRQFREVFDIIKSSLAEHADNIFAPRTSLDSLQRQQNSINKELLLPNIQKTVGMSTVDLLSYSQGIIIANHLNYDPRPVFQSYTAYSENLQRINAMHFTGRKAPDFVMLDLQTIDNRLPTLDDALAILQILGHYRFVLQEKNYLLLKRIRGSPSEALVPRTNGSDITKASVGKPITLPAPQAGSASWARLFVHRTLLGKLYSLAFRDPIVKVEIETSSGRTATYRLIRADAASGFMVGPVYFQNNDILSLYADAPADNIKTIKILPSRIGRLNLIERSFQYSVASLPLRIHRSDEAADILRQTSFKPIRMQPTASDGMCYLDGINGVAAQSLTSVGRVGFTSFIGWASTSKKQAPEEISILLDGPVEYFRNGKTGVPRPDVAEALGSQALSLSGFSVSGSLSDVVSGVYRVKIIEKTSNGEVVCNTQKDIRVSN